MGPVAVIEHAAEVRERAKHAVEEGREAASSVLSDARQIADTAGELVPGTERRRAKKSGRRWLVFAILLGGAIGFALCRVQNRREEVASPNELRPSDRATDRSFVQAVESTAPDAFGAVVAEEQAD